MNKFDVSDVEVLEGGDASPEDYAVSLQRAINSGAAWSFQGSYGRSMMGAIEAGDCMLGERPAHDYYGHRIPARSEVQEGSKGSRAFVVARHDEAWAVMLEQGVDAEQQPKGFDNV